MQPIFLTMNSIYKFHQKILSTTYVCTKINFHHSMINSIYPKWSKKQTIIYFSNQFKMKSIRKLSTNISHSLKDIIPSNSKIIQYIWSFKRKRTPYGQVIKYKARLCAHGGIQQWGNNYWETYTLVINWISIRTMLFISIIYNLDTHVIDFTLDFPQEDLKEKLYMHINLAFNPPDMKYSGDYALQFHKILHGLKKLAQNWFQSLKSSLQQKNFTQSKSEPCLFYRHNAIIVIYVDDWIIFTPPNTNICQNIISSL